MGRVVAALYVPLAVLVVGCGGGGKGTTGDGGGAGTGGSAGTGGGAGTGGHGAGGAPALPTSPLCRTAYPAQACDGDPHGKWTLAAMCVNRWESCPGAVVKTTGTATATIDLQDGSPDAYFDYNFNFDTETRLSVPASCLNGASCETIGCFAGDDPCSCVLGSGNGGGIRARWTPNVSGEVVAMYSDGAGQKTFRFCAGATTADSTIGGTRIIWNRVCTEGMDCRPSDPCHHGKAHCSASSLTCEDSGAQRQVGTPCGTDKVCDAAGACVACAAAGTSCQVDNQPCQAGIVSCASAKPVCVSKGNVADGTACGVKRACLAGVCKTDDGAACTADAECRDSCTCGDAQCTTRFCGRSCICRYAPPNGACAGNLEDGTQTPGSTCKKACFQGRCLTEVGQLCTRDLDCGSGHCTCWSLTCGGGRLCSKMACPCQWAASGADTCGGPLMDGLTDYTCASPKMCVQGACQ